jgi:hypothetical protein
MHFACTEAYFVVNGEGAVQSLSSQGYRETPLRAGSVVWFTPGVIHRLINRDGHLEIFVVMENEGLPELGDSVLTFPDEYLKSEQEYLQKVETEGVSALPPFYEIAVKLMRSKEPAWRKIWRSGPATTIRRTENYLDSLGAGSSDYLSKSKLFEGPINLEGETRKFGFCGTLRPYLPEGVVLG